MLTINSRLAVAVHILSLLEINKEGRITSEYIAGSVNTNAVVVRRIMGMLNKAKLVHTSAGVAGATLARPVHEITLFDVYRAVHADHQEDLFVIHDKPNPQCLVGKNIQGALETSFSKAQNAMEQELMNSTLADIIEEIRSRN